MGSRSGLRRVALLAWLAMLAAGCGELVATPQPVYLRAAGSTTLAPLMADLAAAFNRQTPRVNIQVTGAGTEYGLAALRDGQADLAFASWLPPGPNGPLLEPGWQATAIAHDGIAVIVHPANPIRALGLLQLRDLFGGQVYDWAAVAGGGDRPLPGGVQPVSREEGSATRAAFEALAMEGRPLGTRAIVAASDQEMLDYVAAHPEAIGYVSSAWVTDEVQVVSVEGELPTGPALRAGSYPLGRALWLVLPERPAPAIGPSLRQFLDFCSSPAGQQIVGGRFLPAR